MNFKINGPKPFTFTHPKTGKKIPSNNIQTDHSQYASDYIDKIRKSPLFKAVVAAGVLYVSYKVVIYILNETAELVKAAKKLEKAINS